MTGKEKIRIEGATIDDILQTIKEAEKRGAQFIDENLAGALKGRTSKETGRNIWEFIRSNIRYDRDGERQKIKSPRVLLSDRVGDCKSMTVLAASLLQKMCVPYDLIVDFYDSSQPNNGHIYVKSRGVVIDAVNPKFNSQDKVWRRYKIKGVDVCKGGQMGSRQNNSGMQNTIASYIEGRNGGGVLKDGFINYAQMTDGELSVYLAARQNAIMYAGTKDEKFKAAAADLENLLNNSISGEPFTITSNDRLLTWAKNKLRTKDFPAVTAYYYSPGFRASLGQLPTFEQYRAEEYRKCVDIRKKWAETSILRISRRRELRREWESCFKSVEYLGLVNNNLEKSAAHLLYNFGVGGTTAIQTKRVLHKIAVENYSKVFGISRDNVSMWLRNGILSQSIANGAGAMQAEQITEFMLKNVPQYRNEISNPLAVIAAIVSIISVALTATQIILSRISEVERQRLIANTQGLGTEAFGPEKDDFLGQLQESGAIWPVFAIIGLVLLR